MNHVLAMHCSLPHSLPIPSPSSSLLYPMTSPQQAVHITVSAYPETLSEKEQIKAEYNTPFRSIMQEIHEEEKCMKGGPGLIIHKASTTTSFFYCPPHYTTPPDVKAYSFYRLLSMLLTSYPALYQHRLTMEPAYYSINCKRFLPVRWNSAYSDEANYMAALTLRKQWDDWDGLSSILSYQSHLQTLQEKNRMLSSSSRTLIVYMSL